MDVLAKVYNIRDYADVRKAASALRGLLMGPDWLIDVQPRVPTAKREGVVVVRVRFRLANVPEHVLSSIPLQVNNIKVVVAGL